MDVTIRLTDEQLKTLKVIVKRIGHGDIKSYLETLIECITNLHKGEYHDEL